MRKSNENDRETMTMKNNFFLEIISNDNAKIIFRNNKRRQWGGGQY